MWLQHSPAGQKIQGAPAALSGPRAANRRCNGRPQRWMAPSRCSKRAMGGGMTRQQQGRSHCHSGACTCDGLFSRSSHVAEAIDPFMSFRSFMMLNLDSLSPSLPPILPAICTQPAHLAALRARAAVNVNPDHKQRRCPIDRAAHLLALVTANSPTTWPAPPAYSICRALLTESRAVMGSDRSCCDCHGNDALPVVGLIPSTSARPALPLDSSPAR